MCATTPEAVFLSRGSLRSGNTTPEKQEKKVNIQHSQTDSINVDFPQQKISVCVCCRPYTQRPEDVLTLHQCRSSEYVGLTSWTPGLYPFRGEMFFTLALSYTMHIVIKGTRMKA